MVPPTFSGSLQASSVAASAPSKSLALPQDRIRAAQGLGASSFRTPPSNGRCNEILI